MDTRSPTSREDLVLCVRGTFIDVRQPGSRQTKRTSSAPPRKGFCSDEDPYDADDSEYIAEWIGRAMSLPYHPSRTHQSVCDEGCANHEKAKHVAELANETVHIQGDGLFGLPVLTAAAVEAAEVSGGDVADEDMAHARCQQTNGHTQYTLEGSACAQIVAKGKFSYEGVQGQSKCLRSKSFGEPSTSISEGCSEPIGASFTSTVVSDNDWQEEAAPFDSPGAFGQQASKALGLQDGVATPDPRSELNSESRLWDPCSYNRMNLTRTGPKKDSCHRWLEENIASKHPHQNTPATSEVTTLMLCDIPCRRTVEQIIEVINALGFANTFNLVYMPSKRPKYVQNMGYAFVNFKSAEQATAFGEAFQSFRFPNTSSKKVSYTKPARYQGYAGNLNMYLNQCAMGCLVTFDDPVNGGQGHKHCQ